MANYYNNENVLYLYEDDTRVCQERSSLEMELQLDTFRIQTIAMLEGLESTGSASASNGSIWLATFVT